MFVIEHHVPLAPPANSATQVLAKWNAVYDEFKSMFEKQAVVERFDLIQTFHACKQEEVKPVGPNVIKMKYYVEQLECLGYVLPQDLSVGLILNGLTNDFAGFVRNYNMHNMRKTIGELHALLIEYEKCLPEKAATPQDDACHHYKEVGHYKMNCPAYLAELIKKKKQVGTASSSRIFNENDEISSLVDLLMSMLSDGWKLKDLTLVDVDGKILMIALVDHDRKILMLAFGGSFRVYAYNKDES
ncbi:hypothetical protein Tco_0953768 [Tanacetum coccineum]|uniref:Uncharacterized protein n=1 Tax=Tanacetum coccineum TaxID=301880 RepID=A0ABQ5E178_9ASTR